MKTMSLRSATSALLVDLGRAGGEQVGEALAVAVGLEGQRVALGQQVLRHAVAHHADADESDA